MKKTISIVVITEKDPLAVFEATKTFLTEKLGIDISDIDYHTRPHRR